YLLQSKNLHTAPARLLDERNVRVDGGLAHFGDRRGRIGKRCSGLHEPADNLAWHGGPLCALCGLWLIIVSYSWRFPEDFTRRRRRIMAGHLSTTFTGLRFEN